MEIFSIVCLTVILFVIQHLLNWFWRKTYKEESLLVLGLMLTLISAFISYGIVYTIISWGKNLI